MNVTELIEKVQTTVQDPSFIDEVVLGYINQGLLEIAGLIPLSELETVDTVTTVEGASEVDLPSNYHKHLRRCYSQTSLRSIPIFSNVVRLKEKLYANGVGGIVRGVAVKGRVLCYEPEASATEDLEITYHAMPSAMDDTEDETDYIPAHIGPRILQAYVCKCAFDLIEDGMDGQKLNTLRWESNYNNNLAELALFVGPLYTKPVQSFDEMGL